MGVQRDRALVLSRHPFGESSLVVHVLTPGSGRVSLLAKGAYRTTSRYFAVLDLFDTLELEWSAAPAHELGTLRQGRLDVRRARICTELASYRAALALLELLELVVRHEAPEARLFAASEAALDRLATEPGRADAHLAAFELELLEALGLAPALLECAACGRAAPALRNAPGRAAFSAGAGGRLCPECAREARRAGRRVGTLPVAVLDDARALWQDRAARSRSDGPDGLSAPRAVLVRDFVERFLDYHLETRPKSHRAFLSVPNRNAPASTP